MSLFGKRRIYADAAAATPLSRDVRRRLAELRPLLGNPSSLHREGVAAKRELERSREEAARAIFAHPDEIVFTSGGTEANNLALFGTARRAWREGAKGVHVVTSVIEHPSVLEPLEALEREGAAVTRLPVDAGGRVSAAALKGALRPETILVSIQYVNSEIGTVQDIRALAKEIRVVNKERGEHPILLHVDASQAPLFLSCDVRKLGVDLMTLDAQKMFGPKGAGALFVRRGVRLEPLIQGGGQERGLRSGTENVLLAGAFARALSCAQQDLESRAVHVASVRDHLIDRILKMVPGAGLNGPREGRVANNVNVSIEGVEGELLVVGLDARGVAASARSACASGRGGVSPVIVGIGRSAEHARTSVRFSLLPTATKREADEIVEALLHVLKRHARPVRGGGIDISTN